MGVGFMRFLIIFALSLNFLFFSISGWAIDYPPGIFLNNIPGPIEIDPNKEPFVPLFLLLGSFAEKEVEFFVWREWQENTQENTNGIISSSKEYLDQDHTWKPLEDYSELEPFLRVSLPKYLQYNWSEKSLISPFIGELAYHIPPQGLSYVLHVCLDTVVDGLPPSEEELSSSLPTAACGETIIHLKASASLPTPNNSQSSTPFTQTYLDQELNLTFQGDFNPNDGFQISVDKDKKENREIYVLCSGQIPKQCSVSKVSDDTWLSLSTSKCDGSKIRLNINAANLSEGKHQAEIKIITSCGEKNIPIELTVEPPSPSRPSSQQTEPPSNISENPPSNNQNPPRPTGSLEIALDDSQKGIIINLDAGQTKERKITVTCGGLPPQTCSASKKDGGSWLQVLGCEGSVVTIKTSASGLIPGKSYQGNVKVSTSCGSRIFPITLQVQGACEGNNILLRPDSINIQVQEGSSIPNKIIEVKDNCGQKLQIEEISVIPTEATEWLTAKPSQGILTISFNTQDLSIGTYKANITIQTDLGTSNLPIILKIQEKSSVSTPYIPPSNPSPYTPTNVIRLQHHKTIDLDFTPGEAKLFSFYAAPKDSIPLSVMVGAPSRYSGALTHMLLVNAGPNCSSPPPTISQMKDLIDQVKKRSIPYRGQTNNMHWYISGALVKSIRIYDEMEKTCWYLLVYNDDKITYRNVTVGFTAPIH